MSVIILPILCLYSIALPPLHLGNMCGVDLATMKQLLADQRRDLINDMREQIVSEVANQLAPHAARLDQLQEDQILLKKQLIDISNQLQQNYISSSSVDSNSQPPTSACPAPGPTNNYPPLPCPTTKATPCPPCPTITLRSPTQPCSVAQAPLWSSTSPMHGTLPHLPAIESAKRTLSFKPIPSDFSSLRNHPTEPVSQQTLLERVLSHYLTTKLAIPSQIINRMTPPTRIIHNPMNHEITVTFYSLENVKTVFSHVKNLPSNCRISLFIPPALSDLHNHLRARAYHLRNGETQHKTVIRYQGNSLALYAKPALPANSAWQIVPSVSPCIKAATLPTDDDELGSKNLQLLTMN